MGDWTLLELHVQNMKHDTYTPCIYLYMYWHESIYIDEYEIMPQYLMSLGLNPDWQLLFTAIPENICAALKTCDSAFSLRHVQMLTALQTRDLYQIKGKKIPSIHFQWTDALFHQVSALS